jgi:hypothetical protein
MSGEQGKPKRWYKNWRIITQWFLVVLVLCVITGIIVMGVGGQYGTSCDGYYCTEDKILDAVAHYQSKHNGFLPVLNGTYTNANCSNCNVINIRALLVTNGGLLQRLPVVLNLSASGNDNCGGNASLGCNNYGSYIWVVDTSGNVFSYCAGAGCTTNNSGYQDVWP